ncbi:FAD-dependent oxidoreductase [Streptomyces yangpuensis]|uniref:FAD-dependent oxidoreductase n=1 Tax=Streptomyces yangpuensis TaxID=1648182 RepID=A0ABY5PR24_9ACTN|nr:FAD-dependent oxidoreductase [Streptomyces yangpuensis]UUY46597.1 FAD-dependent oxidoreductase [Streptomyces yangpuensis]
MGLQHQTRDTEVLIVGAGPTGLALAVDLARNGVAALVVERSGSLFPGSRGKGLQPRTLEVLDDLGVYEEIRAAGAPYPVGMVWQDGVRAGEHRMFDDIAPDESAPYAGPWMVAQWRTQEILAARLAELGGEIAFGREAAGVEQDAEGVTVTFVAGAPVRARYAVAADGGRSTVRRALGIGMTGETVDPGPMLVADLRITGLDRDNWHIFPPAGDAGFLAICPLAGTEDFQAVAQFPEGARPDLSLDGIRAVVAARSHLAPDDVTEVRWASDFRPRAAMADRFRDGRVFLAGDSAHVHSPAGGQGLNTSVQDAYNLGWKLAAVLRGGARESLLDTYEEERLPVAAEMLGLSTRIHRGEARRGAATRQLGLGYRDSALAVETRTGLAEEALRAGDRAPDGIRGGVRLFEEFRGVHWTLLAVGTGAGDGSELPDLSGLPGLGAVRTVRIPSYGAYGDGVFLIRPDGHVGWAGVCAEGLASYAAGIAR